MTFASAGRPTLLLVHGAWHRPSSWSKLQDALASRGYRTDTVGLPSAGLEPVPSAGMYDDAAVIRRKVDSMDGPVVVVAHSYGGVPVTQGVAGAANVTGLIYLSAYMLDGGESMFSFHDAAVPARVTGVIPVIDDPGTSLYGDVPDQDRAGAISQLVHQSMLSFVDTVTEVAWRGIESAYVLCENDQAVPMDLQEILAGRATTAYRLASGHSPFLAVPAELADLIDEIVTGAASTDEQGPGAYPDGHRITESRQRVSVAD
jgi:pimeloyl-ACP methyl ester carboxylesterase